MHILRKKFIHPEYRGCLKHGRSFRNHIDKHHTDRGEVKRHTDRGEEYRIVQSPAPAPRPPTGEEAAGGEDESSRQTRNMKRGRVSETNDANKKSRIESSPLKMKIRLFSDPPPQLQTANPVKIEENRPSLEGQPVIPSRGKSKVKFIRGGCGGGSEGGRGRGPVSMLGLDVPDDRDLIMMNQVSGLISMDAQLQMFTCFLQKS